MFPVRGSQGVQAKEKHRDGKAWRVVNRQEPVQWVCWLTQAFLQQTFECLLCTWHWMGWEKVPGAQGTWDRAGRGESGRVALMGIEEDLQWQVESSYMHVFQQLSLFTV